MNVLHKKQSTSYFVLSACKYIVSYRNETLPNSLNYQRYFDPNRSTAVYVDNACIRDEEIRYVTVLHHQSYHCTLCPQNVTLWLAITWTHVKPILFNFGWHVADKVSNQIVKFRQKIGPNSTHAQVQPMSVSDSVVF